MVFLGAVGAEEGAGGSRVPERPIWTFTPTRVDRTREERERLPPRGAAGSARRLVRVDPFPRLDGEAGFFGNGRRWRLAGVVLPPRNRICPHAEGRPWPCGVRAWAWTSGLIAGTRLMCDPPEAEDSPEPIVECFLNDHSVSETILSAGWAEPKDDAPPRLVAAHARAVKARRGLYSPIPPP